MNDLPLIVHLIYRLDFGGLESLLVQCINRLPANKYRHAVVCLTDYTTFSEKITKPDVLIYSLHKKPGLSLRTHISVWKLLRHLRPTILHTYNISTIEYTIAASLVGVPAIVHAEHGRDVNDPHGRNRKYNLLRRILIPLIDTFVPVSADLHNWLRDTIRVPDKKIKLINNGVDTSEFMPRQLDHIKFTIPMASNFLIIGTVGRLQDVKDHFTLIDAFELLIKSAPASSPLIYLAIVGDGPLLNPIKHRVATAGITDKVWLPGARTDIVELLRDFSIFVLPSLAEGTPVTILEAMASGLPVVATQVGGIPEVVVNQQTGILVPPSNPKALATAIATYLNQPSLAAVHGAAGRKRVEQIYSLDTMLQGYLDLYDDLCRRKEKECKTSCAE